MCWLALDRAPRIADKRSLPADRDRWLREPDEMYMEIMVTCKNDNDTTGYVQNSGTLAINVLGDQQLDIGKAFFRTTKVEGRILSGHPYEDGPETGCPLFTKPLLVRGDRHRRHRSRGPHGVRRRGRQRRST
jgi:hypothetical protein